MSIQITINQELIRLKHSISYASIGLVSITTDLKLVGCVIDNSLWILGDNLSLNIINLKQKI